ncbi:MAG: aromatic ring-hydroxylating dioxygenase subunit alpha [Henriciella sp.]|nr:aromatic ring-hydroxylating dioxygenase subunit alpha [Henriciella sp.]
MDQQLQISILKELLRQIDSGANADAGVQYRVPTSIYADPDLAAQEWDQFYQNHPQMIGLSGDLPEPNSFLTLNDFGVPIIATRDSSGKFRAFLNICRHRATRVETEPRGKRKLFVCPFHAWSYSTSGDLVAIADQDDFGEVDKSCRGLIELPAVEAAGLLFVHPKPDGSLDAEALLSKPLLDEMTSIGFDQFVFGADKTIDMKLNWKLANDTFGETYHFQKLHKNTLGQLFIGNNTHMEEFGRHHRFTTANRSLLQMRQLPEEEWQIQRATFVAYHLFPNIQMFWTGDTISLVRIYPDPDNPGRSISQVSIYFTPEAYESATSLDEAAREQAVKDTYKFEEGAVRSPSIEGALEVFTSTIEHEDYVMGEYQQQAAESNLAGEALFGRNEPVLHHFHRSYREALGLPHFETV